ncbi:MAG: chromate efflux transporter [Gemmatimonadota bacterium]
MTTSERAAVSARDALRVWVRIALQSFGGPAGQIAVVQRIVVDEKRWLGEEQFLHALSYCMLLPGPEAQQLVTYIGWMLHGVRGGLIAGSLFILPGFVSILALSVLYAGYHDVGVVAGVFFGVKPAVVVVVVQAILRLRTRALGDRLSVALAVSAFVSIFVFAVPFPLIIGGAAIVGALAMRDVNSGSSSLGVLTARPVEPPSLPATARTAALWLAIWLIPLAALRLTLGADHVFVREGEFFSQTAAVTFGGAYSVLSFVAQRAVDSFHWLTPREMLDGLGMAETTPGPLIQVVQFVGFMGAWRNAGSLPPLAAGVLGSIVTTWMTFAPCFLFIFVGAPYVEYLRQNHRLSAALRGITAAVVGVVANLAAWFALHTLFGELRSVRLGVASLLVPVVASLDWHAAAITLAAALAMFRWKVGMLPTLLGAAVAGVLLHGMR